MFYLTLEPKPHGATYYFPLDATPPEGKLMESSASLSWDADISEINAVPSKVAFATMSSGGKLRELGGRVFFSVGTATPEGKEDYGEQGNRWGFFSYHASPDQCFRVQMHVSETMFDRLVGLVREGNLPAIDISMPDDEGITTSLPDGYLDEWDNVAVPYLPIEWCEFTVRFNHTDVPAKEDT